MENIIAPDPGQVLDSWPREPGPRFGRVVMKKCSDLTNDVLAERPTAPVQAHLDFCASCRARAAELRALSADLSAIAPPPLEDRALVRLILGKMRPVAPRVIVRSASPGRWVAAAAAAIGVAIVLVVATSEPERPRMVAAPERPSLEMILDPVPPPPRERSAPGPRSDPLPRLRTEPVPPPQPKDPAPVVPLPKPIEPEKPEPGPVEPLKPPVPPTETKPAPARVSLAIAQVEGALEMAGKRVEKGAEWEKDAVLRAGERLSRVTLGDGTRLTLLPHAELRMEGRETLALERGEVFCEVIPGAGRKLAVVTPDAAVQVTGTQFGVKRTDHNTEIFVTAGEVRVFNDKGEVSVPAGNGTTARKVAAPAKPRPVDVDAMMGWRRATETPRFRYDFEDSRKPSPWQNGKVVAGPARGLNRNCLEGSPGISLDLSRVDKRVAAVKGTLKVRFRYFAPEGDMLWVQLFDDRVRDNFRVEVKALVHNKWEVFEAPLSDFFLLIDGAAKIQEGDRLSWFNVSVSGTNGPVYYDDIELVEVMK
jgi:hypothetical protein